MPARHLHEAAGRHSQDAIFTGRIARFKRSPMRLLRAVAAVGLLSAGIPVASKAESMLDQIVINKCSSAMQADFDQAGKTPPAGLIQQTCSCVAQQLVETRNLDAAKAICTEQTQSGM